MCGKGLIHWLISISYDILCFYYRRYTKWFSSKGDAASEMAKYCLQNYTTWEEKIEKWQGRILNCRLVY